MVSSGYQKKRVQVQRDVATDTKAIQVRTAAFIESFTVVRNRHLSGAFGNRIVRNADVRHSGAAFLGRREKANVSGDTWR
jgi:hypothetical protein